MLRLPSFLRNSLLVFACVALSACDGGASADTLHTPPALNASDAGFVQSVMGNCVLAFPDIAKIEAAAKASRWKLVTDPSVIAMIAPEEKGGRWKTWGVKQGNSRHILYIGDNLIGQKPIKFCGAITEVEDVDSMAAHLAGLLKAKQEDTLEEAGQRTRIYSFKDAEEPRILSILDANAMQMKMINVSVTTDWRTK